jgi:hypothetical protein
VKDEGYNNKLSKKVERNGDENRYGTNRCSKETDLDRKCKKRGEEGWTTM